MKYILRYLKPFTRDCVMAPLFKALEVVFELCVPLIVAAIIDVGIARGDKGYILGRTGLLLALGVLGLVSALAAQYFSARAACGFSRDVKSALFSHIGGLSYTDLDRLGTSRLITSLTSDVNQVQTGVNLTLRLFLRSPLGVFGAMIMALSIDVRAAVPFVIVIPVLSVVVFGIMLVSIPLYKRVQGALDKVLGRTRENLNGVRVIRAFCSEETEVAQFKEDNGLLTRAQKFVGRISALLNPVTYVIINLAIVLLVWKSAIQVDEGSLTQGQVVALWNYMSQILIELIKLANLIITITKAVACGNRIGAVMQTKPSQSFPTEAPLENEDAPAIEFKNVSLSYHKDGENALTDLSFSIKRGETVGVIGGTGSGKSSLIHMIPRFYDASEGEVLVNGCNVQTYPKDVLLGKIGIVPQKTVLFRGSIRDNLKWGKETATDEECMKAIRRAQAEDVVNAKGGLDAEVEQNGRNLSGGQKQRLTIARALVREPEILILDDAASALDFATDAALRRALAEEKGTVILVSQRISSIRHADKILVLDDGALVGVGTHQELLSSCPVYAEIYDSQHKREEG